MPPIQPDTAPPAARRDRCPACLASEAGFTLVELMVAGLCSSIVIGLAVTSFNGMAQSADGAALLSDLNLSLRSSLNLMTRDMLSAGRDIPVGGISVPSGAGATALARPAPFGSAREFDEDWVVLPAVSPGDGLGPVIGGTATDLVTILVADPDFQRVTVDVADDGASALVDEATPVDGANGIQPGDLIMFAAAGHRALQMVTSRENQTLWFADGDAMHLNQRDAAQGTIMPLVALAQDPVDPTRHPMEATRVLMVSYYIDTSQAARPVLVRRVNLGPERAIGVGIENLQVSYDLVDGDTNPLNEPAPDFPNQIRKANVFLTGRSYRTWGPTLQHLRTSVSTQMSLRSLSFVDRYNLGQ